MRASATPVSSSNSRSATCSRSRSPSACPPIQLHDPYVLWNTMSVLVAVGSTVQIEHVICASESRWKTRGSASSCRRITSRSDASCWLKGR